MKQNVDHHGYIERIEKLGLRYLPVEDWRKRRTNNESWRTVENLHVITHGNVTEMLRKHLGLDFLRGNNFSQQFREREKCLKGWTLFLFTSPPIYSKIGEKLAAQLAQASKVASSRGNSLLEESSGGPKWAWLLFAPPLFTKCTPFLFFCNSFSVTLRNFTNFVMILIFSSARLRTLMNYVFTLF